MELNQYLYMQGEVVRLFLPPRGPTRSWISTDGRPRRCYFDTSATAHALDEPCYIVEPFPGRAPSCRPTACRCSRSITPTTTTAERKLGTDSRLMFTAPADGAYLVRVSDTAVSAASGSRIA